MHYGLRSCRLKTHSDTHYDLIGNTQNTLTSLGPFIDGVGHPRFGAVQLLPHQPKGQGALQLSAYRQKNP